MRAVEAPADEQVDAALDAAWARLLPLLFFVRDRIFRAIERHGLTPPHGHTLLMLSGGPVRMRDIADSLLCDASYVTAIVDKLEALGYATRQPSATDRRVKEIALTPAGKQAVDEIQSASDTPPDVLAQLSVTERKTLAAILSKIDMSSVPPPPWGKLPARR